MSIDPQTQARILIEALPHMQRYDEEIVVVKYGGHAMGEEQTARDFARDIVLLEQTAINPVVVHGGGPQIAAMLKKLGIKSEFAAGLRITDEKTIEIVEMVLAGSINKQIVGYINAAGGKAIGLCGKDGNMVQARKVTRRPPANSDLMLSFLSMEAICGPPPCTTTGLIAVCSNSTTSRAKSRAACSSPMAWPPYLMTTVSSS